MAHLILEKIAYDFDTGSVSVRVDIDGSEVKAKISAEAIQDDLGERTALASALVECVKQNANAVSMAVEQKFRVSPVTGNAWILIRSGDIQ